MAPRSGTSMVFMLNIDVSILIDPVLKIDAGARLLNDSVLKIDAGAQYVHTYDTYLCTYVSYV
jgi:hypothetical protein